jgi:putative acetyltransferase
MEHGDVDAVLLLFDAVAAERTWIGTEPGYDRAAYKRTWEAGVRDPRVLLLVASQAESVVGHLAVYPDPEGFLVGMLVAQDVRGRGIGTALLTRAFAWARVHDVRALHLDVFPHNTAAIALYRKMGFTGEELHVARMRRQNGEAWDVLQMRKDFL